MDLRSDGGRNVARVLVVPVVGWARAESFDMWACRALPGVGDFVKVRVECAVFKARENFEAWADEQHQETLRKHGWAPDSEEQAHMEHLASLYRAKGATLPGDEEEDRRS